MLKQFAYNFSDLLIKSQDLEQLLGFTPGEVPDPFPYMIESAFLEAPELFEIRAGYRLVEPVGFDSANFRIEAGGKIFSPGRIVFKQLRNADKLAVYSGTAGRGTADRCKKLNQEGDEVYSYVLDVMGSIVAGKSVERMADDLEEMGYAGGWTISDSFSPGYCDWSVAEQQQLFSFFPPEFLGITLSPSSLMSPVKSVSGIIGAGRGLKRNGGQCRLCSDTSCFYGKIRRENQQ